MEIRTNKAEKCLTVDIIGRMDSTTAPQLESELKEQLEGISELVLNLKELEYISSAGLRVMLFLQKTMNKQGKMTVKNVKDTVAEIFEVTGFVDILNIE